MESPLCAQKPDWAVVMGHSYLFYVTYVAL